MEGGSGGQGWVGHGRMLLWEKRGSAGDGGQGRLVQERGGVAGETGQGGGRQGTDRTEHSLIATKCRSTGLLRRLEWTVTCKPRVSQCNVVRK